ncbi:potassium-transporting ATPase A chain [Striga asiatica]|uniref:Potassium-transporting ATPase A chain n=1 Tax=Striga asiatica TaxID=4170 RepID=A0A5A7P0B3_STRAF|nr:potassium-transporting ATPase A chain [Striga asiatica]
MEIRNNYVLESAGTLRSTSTNPLPNAPEVISAHSLSRKVSLLHDLNVGNILGTDLTDNTTLSTSTKIISCTILRFCDPSQTAYGYIIDKIVTVGLARYACTNFGTFWTDINVLRFYLLECFRASYECQSDVLRASLCCDGYHAEILQFRPSGIEASWTCRFVVLMAVVCDVGALTKDVNRYQ